MVLANGVPLFAWSLVYFFGTDRQEGADGRARGAPSLTNSFFLQPHRPIDEWRAFASGSALVVKKQRKNLKKDSTAAIQGGFDPPRHRCKACLPKQCRGS
jgi:hypothetical protein